jgi:hypothetical protein
MYTASELYMMQELFDRYYTDAYKTRVTVFLRFDDKGVIVHKTYFDKLGSYAWQLPSHWEWKDIDLLIGKEDNEIETNSITSIQKNNIRV